MHYRPLGRTGLNVSAICLGTMTFGEQNTQEEGFAQMDLALERGINFFDTAELYAIPPKPETQGATEEIIGNWFKTRGSRDKVILATKVVGQSERMDWFREDGSLARLTKAQIFEAVDKSLKRLKTDYIDLYQLHWPERSVPLFGSIPTVYNHPEPYAQEESIATILETLGEIVKAGKVRHIGLSNESAWGAMRFVTEAEKSSLPRVASVQNAYNLLNRVYEMDMAEIAHREDLGLLAYSPLAQGYLTGKYRGGALPKGSRKQLFSRLGRYETDGADVAMNAYFKLADELGVSYTHLALQFVTSRSFVTSNIIGATSVEQLKDNLASLEFEWNDEVEQRVNAIHQVHQNPCP